MKLFYRWLVSLSVCVATVACADYSINEQVSGSDLDENVAAELLFGVPQTRAVLDEGLNLRWERGDRIYIMAYDGQTPLFSKEANFWTNLVDNSDPDGYSQAYFKAKFYNDESDVLEGIKSLADGKCYAVSPASAVTIDGTVATVTMPSVQSGEFSDAPHFMTARSSDVINELKVSTGSNEDYINDVNLEFVHHTHLFKVKIPNNNLGKDVARAYLKFPFAVVGEMSVDYTTGEVVALNNTDDLVVVEFNEPKSAGDEFWVLINGVEGRGNVEIRFQAVDGTYSERRVASFSQKDWVAGAVSKINVSVPQAVSLTSVKYTVTDYSKLGEPVTHLRLKLNGGAYFTDYKTEGVASAAEAESGEIEFKIFSDVIDENFRQASHSLVFESENALVPSLEPIVYGEEFVVGGVNAYELSAPYIFAEDFSKIPTFNDGHDNPKVGLSSDTYKGITELSSKTSILKDWYAARIGTQSATSVRICCRYENVLGGKGYYKGRLYTPFMSNIKAGKTVKLAVSFKYGCSISERNSKPKANPLLYFGTDSQETVVNMDDTGLGSVVSGGGYSDQAPSSLISKGIDGEQLTNSGGSYTSFTGTKQVTISDVSNRNRLAWILSTTNTSSNTNGNYWLYLDDITVSIAN